MNYEEFLSQKRTVDEPSGFDAMDDWLSERGLFPFQDAIVRWAVKRGRAAIFADTGLGKTRMQVAWAEQVSQYNANRVLILAPLCVAPQTVEEAARMGVTVRYIREMCTNDLAELHAPVFCNAQSSQLHSHPIRKVSQPQSLWLDN